MGHCQGGFGGNWARLSPVAKCLILPETAYDIVTVIGMNGQKVIF
jgi:hypothetical protein